MTFTDEVLMAYADGELDAQTRAAVEAAMASDPEIARRISRHEALRNRVHSAFNGVLDEPVPARLLKEIREDPALTRNSNVVPLERREARLRAHRWRWPQWIAVAASLIVGLIVGRLMSPGTGSPAPIVIRDGRMLAAGSVAGALSNQLVSDQTGADPVRIGVSFRSRSGEYCRTFALRQPADLAGLACRTAGGWQIGVLARTQLPHEGAGVYRQATSSMPPAVIAAISNEIVGEALDARAESAARERQWRP